MWLIFKVIFKLNDIVGGGSNEHHITIVNIVVLHVMSSRHISQFAFKTVHATEVMTVFVLYSLFFSVIPREVRDVWVLQDQDLSQQ